MPESPESHRKVAFFLVFSGIWTAVGFCLRDCIAPVKSMG